MVIIHRQLDQPAHAIPLDRPHIYMVACVIADLNQPNRKDGQPGLLPQTACRVLVSYLAVTAHEIWAPLV